MIFSPDMWIVGSFGSGPGVTSHLRPTMLVAFDMKPEYLHALVLAPTIKIAEVTVPDPVDLRPTMTNAVDLKPDDLHAVDMKPTMRSAKED